MRVIPLRLSGVGASWFSLLGPPELLFDPLKLLASEEPSTSHHGVDAPNVRNILERIRVQQNKIGSIA